MKILLAISLAISTVSLGELATAQSYNKTFAESERRLASQCITVYQNTPEDGDAIVSTCLASLKEMQALKNRTYGLTDTDTRLFYLYSTMATAGLTMGELQKNGGRVSTSACTHGREAIALGEKVGFQEGSDYDARVQRTIDGFKKHLMPNCVGR